MGGAYLNFRHSLHIVFIPNAGKLKDYKPTSLSSFLLKIMKRLLSLNLHLTISPNDISSSQHPYRKIRSTEPVLFDISKIAKKALSNKKYALIAFIVNEYPFNNILPCSIIASLNEIGIGDRSVHLMQQIIVHWSVKAWRIVYSSFIAFAFVGKFSRALCDPMADKLGVFSAWAHLFTRKYKIPNLRLPKFLGESLTLSDSPKYLSVTLKFVLMCSKIVRWLYIIPHAGMLGMQGWRT